MEVDRRRRYSPGLSTPGGSSPGRIPVYSILSRPTRDKSRAREKAHNRRMLAFGVEAGQARSRLDNVGWRGMFLSRRLFESLLGCCCLSEETLE